MPPLSPTLRTSLVISALAVSVIVSAIVILGVETHWLTVAWILSVLIFGLAHLCPARFGRPTRRSILKILPLLLVAILPVLVRVVQFDSTRMHQDEFITGYFSATHDFRDSSFFAFMPAKNDWQGQYPKVFFFLQRIFFTVFGASFQTIRLSVQPYVALVSVMLFLIVREILDQPSAFIAVAFYAFLAVSLYLETLGLIFVSATAILMVFSFFALRWSRTGSRVDAAMTGLSGGFCYLVHYTSYIAFPVLFAFVLLQFLRTRQRSVFRKFGVVLAGVLVVLAPFAAWSLRFGGYVFNRANQVSLLTGEWSPFRAEIASGTSRLSIIKGNLVLCLRSFFQDNIGGNGGYDFGHLAFFDPISMTLFIAGILVGLGWLSSKPQLLFVFLMLGAAFVGGMVLTIPPPAYHRWNIAFPFVAIVMTLPLSLLLRCRWPDRVVRSVVAGGFVFLVASCNERRFVEATLRDSPAAELRLSELINQRYPKRPLYIAAFRSFAFQKIFYFQDRSMGREVKSAKALKFLKRFRRDEKYVYVMILPDEFRERFEKADPTGRFFRFSSFYAVFAN
jgi:hypothetical protein